MKSESSKGVLVVGAAILLIIGVYSSRLIFGEPELNTPSYLETEEEQAIEKRIESISGVFADGVLKGASYDIEEVGAYRVVIRLKRDGEAASVLYKLPLENQKAGWCSLYGNLQPNVEKELETKFRPVIDELTEFHRKQREFRNLIYSYE